MKKLFFIAIVLLGFSCENSQRCQNQTVHCYKTHDNTGELFFWYLMWSANSNSYYYYSSSTEITNYSTISWEQSTTNPIDNFSEGSFEQMSDQQVDAREFSNEMQDEVGDPAYDNDAQTEGDWSSGDNSSDGGSYDGGSSDGGGDYSGGE